MELRPSPHAREVPPACQMGEWATFKTSNMAQLLVSREDWKMTAYLWLFMHISNHFDPFFNVPRNQSVLCRASCKEHGSGSIKPSDSAGVTWNPHGSVPNETWRFLQTREDPQIYSNNIKYQSHFFSPSLAQNFQALDFQHEHFGSSLNSAISAISAITPLLNCLWISLT